MDGRDVGAGVLFIGVGAFYGAMSYFNLRIGAATHMGPGYFPLVLSLILIGIGLVVLVPALFRAQAVPWGPIPWRGLVAITAAIAFFGALHGELGLFAAVSLSAFIACLASPRITWPRAILTSLGAGVFCSVTFVYGIGLPLPLIGPWLTAGGF